MTENQESHHNDRFSNPSDHPQLDGQAQADPDIIELSDIAVGITPEDDAIVELTEDIIGEAFFGFNKATSEKMEVDENELDLSDKRAQDGLTPHPDDTYRPPMEASATGGSGGPVAIESDLQDEDISLQLDRYFGFDEDPSPAHTKPDQPDTAASPKPEGPVVEAIPQVAHAAPAVIRNAPPIDADVTTERLDEAIERVIRKLYAEKINRILDAMIERTVTEEISQLKEYLIGVAQKKD